MTLIIQKSYMIHLGDITNLTKDHTEDEWRYLIDIKFTKPYHKLTFAVMLASGLIVTRESESLLRPFGGACKPITIRMFAMYNNECLEVGDCYISEIPIKWEVLKDKTEVQLLFIKEGRRDFIEQMTKGGYSEGEAKNAVLNRYLKNR